MEQQWDKVFDTKINLEEQGTSPKYVRRLGLWDWWRQDAYNATFASNLAASAFFIDDMSLDEGEKFQKSGSEQVLDFGPRILVFESWVS